MPVDRRVEVDHADPAPGPPPDVPLPAPAAITTGRQAHRVAAFDGVRGVACLLVVLSHLWAIVPPDMLSETGPLHGLFLSGNFGVTMFFVLGGFLVTTRLVERESGRLHARVAGFWVRRSIRIMPQLVLLAIVLVVVSSFDRWDEWSAAQTRRSVITTVTFTLNWSLVGDALANRPDVGHLWYLSVEQQTYVVLIPVIILLSRQRAALAALTACAAVVVVAWRFHVLDADGWWPASLRTTTRADGILFGVTAALAAPALVRWRSVSRSIVTPSLVTIVFIVLLTRELDELAYLQWPGVVFVIAVTLLVLGLAVSRRPSGAQRVLGSAPLRWLGAISFPLYVWHLPIFYASARWLRNWAWQPRAVAAGVAVAAVVALSVILVERPVARLIRRR